MTEEVKAGEGPDAGTGASATPDGNNAGSGTSAPPVTSGTTEGQGAEPSEAEKRIRRLAAEKNAAREEAAYWRGKAEAGGVKPDKTEAPKEDAPPRATDFQNEEDYLIARTRYEVRQEYKAQQAQDKADAEKKQLEESTRKFNDRIEKAKDKYPDFQDVALRQPQEGGPAITPAMAEVLKASENGADIAYYLGKNVDESKRIAAMHPLLQIKEIGILEAKILANPIATKKTTSAPAPINTVGGGGVLKTVDLSDPNLSPEERIKAWRAQEAS